MKELLIMLQLARVIAGEAPSGCSMAAKAAVARVADNRVQQGVVQKWREGWYGNQDPETIDVVVALLWRSIPDPTSGATNLIGPHDYFKMPWLSKMQLTWHEQCQGTSLAAYR